MSRSIDGILLLDKPSGITSNRALQVVKRLYAAEKAGHTGSLDPLATGMLPICFGQATKISRYLLAARKRYQVSARLGAATETGDADGEVIARAPVPALDRDAVARALTSFHGAGQQVPPMYSALKHQGERLYKLARRGEQVERPARKIFISEITLLHYQPPVMSFTVTCSKGTYVRSLVQDIGQALGTLGHVVKLRRLGVEPFVAEPLYTLEALRARAQAGWAALEDCLLPVDRGLVQWARVDLAEDAARRLGQGQRVPAEPTWPAGQVRVYSADRGFLGIGEIVAKELVPRRLFAASGGSR
jgi:tRNA pseudouridine55 synthase